MKPTRRKMGLVTAIGLAVGLGLAAGFLSRTLRGPTSGSELSRQEVLELKSGNVGPRTGNKLKRVSKDESPLVAELERNLASLDVSDGVGRWFCWFEAMEKAAPADFPRLARLAKGDAMILRVLTLRWMERDPLHLLENLAAPRSGVTDEIAWLFFEEWPKRDPEGAITALSRPEHAAHRYHWGGHVVGAVLETDVERGLKLVSEWDVRVTPRMEPVAKWAAANPRHAAEFSMAHMSDHIQDLALEIVGKEWGTSDPRAAVEFGIHNGAQGGFELAKSALKVWTDKSLVEASEWLTEVDARTRHRLGPAFVEQWAGKDLANALDWSEANLSGSGLREAIGAAMRGGAEKDLPGAAQLVAQMQPSRIRAEAASAVADKWLPHWSAEDRVVAPEATQWLAGLDRQSVVRVLENTQWWWASSDPESLAGFLAGYGEELTPHAYNSAVRYLARKNPVEAIDWAGRLPGNARVPVGARAFSEWHTAQFDAAMDWLQQLPAKDPRRKPFFETAVRDMVYDERAGDQLVAMPESYRAAAREIIEREKMPEDRRMKLLEATRTIGPKVPR